MQKAIGAAWGIHLGKPEGRLLVPPVQPQGATEIIAGLVVPSTAKENAAADEMKPGRMGAALRYEQGKGKPAAPVWNEARKRPFRQVDTVLIVGHYFFAGLHAVLDRFGPAERIAFPNDHAADLPLRKSGERKACRKNADIVRFLEGTVLEAISMGPSTVEWLWDGQGHGKY